MLIWLAERDALALRSWQFVGKQIERLLEGKPLENVIRRVA